MLNREPRTRLLVVVASPSDARADSATHHVADLYFDLVVYRVRGTASCLRVATAIGPDLVLIDGLCTRTLEGMLRSHPTSAAARLVRAPTAAIASLLSNADELRRLLSSEVDRVVAPISTSLTRQLAGAA